MKLDEYKQKAKDTNIKNNGVHNLTLPDIQEKAKKAFEKRYGGTLGNVEEIKKDEGHKYEKVRRRISFTIR